MRMLLEEHFHEAEGTSYSDAQASGFEVLTDDVVVKSFLNKGEATEVFEVATFTVSTLHQCMHIGTRSPEAVLCTVGVYRDE